MLGHGATRRQANRLIVAAARVVTHISWAIEFHAYTLDRFVEFCKCSAANALLIPRIVDFFCRLAAAW